MEKPVILRIVALFVLCVSTISTYAASDINGVWILSGPGSESDIVLTQEGQRIRDDYDLLVDDPSLYCVPASVARIWANPNSRIKIESTASQILISYELFDLRRQIPVGDESDLTELPSTKNLDGTYFYEMGSSFARYTANSIVIESRNHVLGYLRTSRGIPQGDKTVAREILEVDGDTLKITHTYTDSTLYEQPIVLQYSFKKSDAKDVAYYACTDANYDWFDELNAGKEGDNQ